MTFNKIAIFRALQLGDMLCGVPALRAIRKAYPSAEIALIGLPWAEEFSKRFDNYIDTFIAFPGYPGLPEQKADTKKFDALITMMQKEQFDLVIQMHGDGSITNQLISQFKGKITAGSYIHKKDCPDITTFIRYRDDISEIERNLRILKKFGITSHNKKLSFPIREKEIKELEKLPEYNLLNNASYICLHAGARDVQRRWDPTYFAFVADTLITLGYDVVLTGVTEEREIVQEVMNHMKYEPINFVGKLSLGATAALIKNARLVISNCTAISHIADALAIPSVVVYLASDPVRWAPLDKTLHRVVTTANASQPFTVLAEAMKVLKLKDAIEDRSHREQKGVLYGTI